MSTKWRDVVKKNIFTFLFFATLLFIGAGIYKDYGVACDEFVDRSRGISALDFMTGKDDILVDRHYGASFEITLVVLEKAFGLEDMMAIAYLRHLMVFLTFYIGVLCFYFLANRIFSDNKWSLIACAFLVINPRIFSQSFYNSKDSVFLSLFIVAILTMLQFIKKPGFLRVILHGFITAFLINVRIIGVLIIAFTFGYTFWLFIRDKKLPNKEKNIYFPYMSLYSIIVIIFTVFLWPFLWSNPVKKFIESFALMSNYSWGGTMLYLGDYISGTNAPWHYIPLWMLITIPVLYIAGFILFFFLGIKKIFFVKNESVLNLKEEYTIILIWFLLPIFIVIILSSTLYGDWRHLYFVYPAFVLLSVSGVYFLNNLLQKKLRGKYLSIIAMAIVPILLIISFSSTIFFIIKNHPNENVYFNYPARKIFSPIKMMFDLDFLGISYRQGLEYIVQNDSREEIKILAKSSPGVTNALILPAFDRNRIIYLTTGDGADYLIGSYRYQRYQYACDNEVYSIEVSGQKILSVCKL